MARIKKGWLESDCDSGTILVIGSISHCEAPVATHIETPNNKTEFFCNKITFWHVIYYLLLQRTVDGCRQAITSVNRRSNAFKSVFQPKIIQVSTQVVDDS